MMRGLKNTIGGCVNDKEDERQKDHYGENDYEIHIQKLRIQGYEVMWKIRSL